MSESGQVVAGGVLLYLDLPFENLFPVLPNQLFELLKLRMIVEEPVGLRFPEFVFLDNNLLSGGEVTFDLQNMVLGSSVADGSGSGGIVGEHPSYLAGVPGGGVGGKHQPMSSEVDI